MFFFFSDAFDVTNFGVKSLLSLPNLEKLDLSNSFSKFTFHGQLPEMKKMTKFSISFAESSNLNILSLNGAVTKMPALQNLRVKGLSKEQILVLIYDASIYSISLGKEVVIIEKRLDEKNCWKLRIESEKNVNQVNVPTLILEFYGSCNETYFNDVSEFVYKRLKGFRAVKLESN